jgi:hypothetical protein
MNIIAKTYKRLPWYGWLLVPIVFPGVLIFVGIPLGVFALLSIPYYFIFPEHHRQAWDFESTPHQRELLVKWRSQYSRLGLIGRVQRGTRLALRRRNVSRMVLTKG